MQTKFLLDALKKVGMNSYFKKHGWEYHLECLTSKILWLTY